MITGAQLRMARGYLKWSAKELADKAGVAKSTIKRMNRRPKFPGRRAAQIEGRLQDAGRRGDHFCAGKRRRRR